MKLAVATLLFALGPVPVVMAQSGYDAQTPREMSVLLAEGYEIVAVLAAPFATPEMDVPNSQIERNKTIRLQREVYLQRQDAAAVCFLDFFKLDAACYDMLYGEPK
ncbi:MAG: hypothetical protein AAF968_22735 [Pseudomonadota bacterium]